ncbi:MAG TPA: neutral zinc metallopeptidase [Propionibacteriaceae bacterium]|nr:neutral zinc metallopeptidase [Propionibacteriaceae bacterium]
MAFVLVGMTIAGFSLGSGLEVGGGGITTWPATPGQSTTRPVTPTPPRSPTPTPTPTPTARARPTATTFTNDGYQVPAPPATPLRWLYPQSRQEAVAWTQSNVLYGHTIGQPVRCPRDPIVTSTEIPRAQFEAGVNAFVDCLMGAWRVPMQAAGYQLPRPAVAFFTSEAVSPCGNATRDEVSGMYCTANATFYIPYGQRVYRNADGWATYVLEIVIAHEFAHHVQARTGLLGGMRWLDTNVGDPNLELSRRKELQAQCFAGLGLSATAYSMGMTAADRRSLQISESNRGDRPGQPRTHGTFENSGRWFSAGFTSTAVSTCNTYTAPASTVE